MSENIFKIPPIRQAYSNDYAKYGRPGVVSYWFEMEHPFEGHRDFSQTLDIYLNDYNWRKILKPGTTIVDIGAHSGDTAVPMMAMSGYCVLTAECNPTIYPWLEFACHMNRHLGKFIPVTEAVTTEDNVTVTFSDHNNGMCNGGLVNHNWGIGAGSGSIDVPGMRLDTLCRKYLNKEELDRIDLIKIDTEGHDFAILDASREFIDAIRPKLFAEWFSGFGTDAVKRMFDIIKSMDYVALYPRTFGLADPSQPSEDLLLIHRTKMDSFLKEVQ
jgi:FkbM family methyltransferase